MGRSDKGSPLENANALHAVSHQHGSKENNTQSHNPLPVTIEIDNPLADLSIEDFRSLVRLSTARMACFDFATPVSTTTSRAEFIADVYSGDATLVEASEAFARHACLGSVKTALGHSLNEI